MKYVYKDNKTGLYFNFDGDTNNITAALIIYDDEVWRYLSYHYSKVPYDKELQNIRKLKLKKINNVHLQK